MDFPTISQTLAVAGTTYSDVFEVGDVNNIESSLQVSALSGTGVSFKIITQYSYNKDDSNSWKDHDSTVQYDEVTNATTIPFDQALDIYFAPPFFRYKKILAGTTPSVTYKLYTLAKK